MFLSPEFNYSLAVHSCTQENSLNAPTYPIFPPAYSQNVGPTSASTATVSSAVGVGYGFGYGGAANPAFEPGPPPAPPPAAPPSAHPPAPPPPDTGTGAGAGAGVYETLGGHISSSAAPDAAIGVTNHHSTERT